MQSRLPIHPLDTTQDPQQSLLRSAGALHSLGHRIGFRNIRGLRA